MLVWLSYKDIGFGCPLQKIVSQADTKASRERDQIFLQESIGMYCTVNGGSIDKLVRKTCEPWVGELLNFATTVKGLGNNKYGLRDYHEAADLYQCAIMILSAWTIQCATPQEQVKWKELSLDCFSNYLQVCIVSGEYERGQNFIPFAIRLATEQLEPRKRAKLMFRCAVLVNEV